MRLPFDPEKEPGLVFREVIDCGGNSVILNEMWDLTAPGCVLRHYDSNQDFIDRAFGGNEALMAALSRCSVERSL